VNAVDAIRAGELVLLPTDTVYGLCTAESEEAARRIAELKGRPAGRPIALLFADVDTALARAPGLERAAHLLPGPFTLVVGGLGVRVPQLPAGAVEVVRAVGCVLATSANRHGGPDPRRLDDVPPELRAACAAEVDAGELPGVASTVIDLDGREPRVLREGAVPAAEALARLGSR
jgi:tRNA A37 threonylcarbamoyladenosine synthetase subunit TsaC/SUA5/YrdC